jgi:Leucine-rich repeat (LRR) protein
MLALSHFGALTELRLLDQVGFEEQQQVTHALLKQVAEHPFPCCAVLLQRIERIEGLQGCPNLKKLWLIENRISVIENLDPCTGLQELYLTSNRITDIGGLDALVSLQVGPPVRHNSLLHW